MKHQPIWKLSVNTTPSREESVAQLLTNKTGEPPVSYTDLDSGNSTVSVYSKTKWNKHSITAISSVLGPRNVRLTKLRPQDWAESWKRHFKPLEIGRKLLVQPSWSKRRPKPGQVVVVLDPGMSFGTGQHPTTSFCLREIARLRKPGHEQSLLDAGTGSGILAVCAAKLGYRLIEAFDIDPDCLKTARSNASRNNVSKVIQVSHGDVTKMSARAPKQYTVVCANLVGDLLLQHRDAIVAKVKPGGFLIVAGILKNEFSKIRTAYEQVGLELLRSKVQNEWQSACLAKPVV